MKDTIALVGEWNTTNVGDRAIGLYAAEYLLSLNFNVKLFALGSFRYLGDVSTGAELPQIFSTSYGSDLGFDNSIKKDLARAVHRYFPRAKFFFRFFRNYLNRKSLIRELSQCQALLIGGGALLDDDGLHFPSSLFLFKTVSRNLKLPIYCVGCSSSGKFSMFGKLALRNFIQYASVVAVRDTLTRDAIQSLCKKNIYVYGDFALRTSLPMQAKISDVKRIGLNVMHFVGEHKVWQAGYELFLVQLITFVNRKKDWSLVLFTTGDNNDLKMAQRLQELTGTDHQIFHLQTFESTVTFFKNVDVTFCTRLHSAILSISAGVPALALSVTPKIKNFFYTIGLLDYCIQAKSIHQRSVNKVIFDILDKKLPNYFGALNFEYFTEGREVVSKALTDLKKVRRSEG